MDSVCDIRGQADLRGTLILGPPVDETLTQQALEHLWHPDWLETQPTGQNWHVSW